MKRPSRPPLSKTQKPRARGRPVLPRGSPTRLAASAAQSGAVRLWADVSPGAYGVLYPGTSLGLKQDEDALAALSEALVFPSLDVCFSLSPDAVGSLHGAMDLERLARVFGRATRIFVDVELDYLSTSCTVEVDGCAVTGSAVQVLGLWPHATAGEEPPREGVGTALVEGLTPVLVPLAGPFAALVKGASVLFRALAGARGRPRLLQVAYQRDERAFGWCLGRPSDGGGLLEGLHRATALLAVSRALALAPESRLGGRLRIAVDLDGNAENVFLERRFDLPLASYAVTRPVAPPSPKLREARKVEDLPMLLSLADAAAVLGLPISALWADGGFRPPFQKRFRSASLPGGDTGSAAIVIERDSFLAFVFRELLG